VVPLHELPLERLVTRCLGRVGPEEVANSQVAAFVVASGCANVEVIPVRASWRSGEEVIVGATGIRKEAVAEGLKRTNVWTAIADINDRDLDVDDWLRCQTKNGRRSDVVDANREIAEGVVD
jgi:hypothetical protein